MGNIAIVTSDGQGLISAFSPYSDLWTLRLSDLRQLKVYLQGLWYGDFIEVKKFDRIVSNFLLEHNKRLIKWFSLTVVTTATWKPQGPFSQDHNILQWPQNYTYTHALRALQMQWKCWCYILFCRVWTPRHISSVFTRSTWQIIMDRPVTIY